MTARHVLNAIVGRWGYELKDKARPPRGLAGFVSSLRSRGFRPDTVIDVGVGPGTPWLYEGFPDARFELFEALDVFVPDMKRICERLNGQYHVVALGAESGFKEIDVDVGHPGNSTLCGFAANRSPHRVIDRRPVEVKRLDDFGPFGGTILLKLDVEGFELNVLKGAIKTLEKTEVIISEVSVRQQHRDQVSFGTFVSYVESVGFSLIDVPHLSSHRRDGSLAYVDAAFARSNSRLRY